MTDWYVRPSGGTYGAEDGTSYADAWDGFANITWGVGGVVAGDTLYICGTHSESLTIGVSGEADNAVIVRGDYPGDSGRVEVYKEAVSLTWADQGGNVWSTNITDTGTVYRVLLDEVGYTEAADAISVNATNRWFQSTSTLYVYATSDPNGFYSTIRVLQNESDTDDCVSSVDKEYFTLKNITLYGGGRWTARFIQSGGATANLTGVVIDNVTVRMSGLHGIQIESNNTTYFWTGVTVKNCHCDRQWFATESQDTEPGGNGIYLDGNVRDSSIQSNTIIDYGHSSVELLSQASMVISGNAVHGNRAYVVNSPYMRGFNTGPNGGTASIDGNLIYNNNWMGCNIQDQLNGQNNKYYCNLLKVIDSAASATGTDGLTLGTQAAYGCTGNTVANNVFFEVDRSAIELTANTTNMGANTIVNNIVYEAGQDESSKSIVLLAPTGGASRATQAITNNCVFAAAGGNLITVDGTDYTVAGADANVADFSNNASVSADPQLDANYRPQNLKFRYEHRGVKVDGVVTDFDGRKFFNPPSIGAYQLDQPGVSARAQAVVLSDRVVPVRSRSEAELMLEEQRENRVQTKPSSKKLLRYKIKRPPRVRLKVPRG